MVNDSAEVELTGTSVVSGDMVLATILLLWEGLGLLFF